MREHAEVSQKGWVRGDPVGQGSTSFSWCDAGTIRIDSKSRWPSSKKLDRREVPVSQQIDLRKLAEASGPDRCFLSVFLNAGSDVRWFERRVKDLRELLEPSGDERTNLDHTAEMVRRHLDGKAPKSGSVAIFACWLSDFFDVVALPVELEEKVILDSSPYVRPLAEYADEYETFCIVLLDHKKAKVYLVAGADISHIDSARGDIKNHVRKGGWSQQRYERRRDKQIHHYCEEISQTLERLAGEEHFDRLLIAGDKVLINELQVHLSTSMKQRVAAAAPLRAGLGEQALLTELFPAFVEGERRAERRLYETIREECFHGGRAATGAAAVLAALGEGRVARLLVDRELHLEGYRCRDCELLDSGLPDRCPECGGEVFEVELVNEMVELATKTGGDVEFSDSIGGLTHWGGVAALLRY